MEEWEWEMEIQEKNFFLKNKGIGISKDDYNTKRSKRHDFQLSTQKKEMGIIKLQFYPSSKIYLGDWLVLRICKCILWKNLLLIVWLAFLWVKNVKRHFKIKRYVEHFVMNKISFHFTKIALILFSLYDSYSKLEFL